MFNRVNYLPCFCCLFALALTAPALAQSGGGAPALPTISIGHPEGSVPPAFCSGLDALFPLPPGQTASQANYYPLIAHTEYEWLLPDGSVYSRSPNSHTDNHGTYSISLGGFSLHFDYSDPSYTAMTPSGLTLWVFGQDGVSKVNTQYPAPYVLGVTLFKVVAQSGAALPGGVVVTMQSQTGTVSRFTLASGKSTCSFGQGVHTASDAPYPPGLASDAYELYVTAPGLASSPEGTFTPGTGYAGQTVSVVLAPAGSTAPAPTSAPTTAADNPDVVAPAAPADGGASAFFTDFWAKLKAFVIAVFTPDPADIDALKASATRFATWGPFALPATIKAAWDHVIDTQPLTNADPRYWWFPLNMGAFTAISAPTAPSGYTEGNEAGYSPHVETSRALMSGYRPYIPVDTRSADGRYLRPSALTGPGTVMDPNVWARLIPDHWDFRAYSSAILVLRAIEWGAAWLFFGMALKNRFTPSLKV